MKILKSLSLTMMLVVGLSMTSCSDDDSGSKDGTSSISVKLVDAPGDYDEVLINVVDVMVKYSDDDTDMTDGSDDDGWISLEAINTGEVNLLDLTGGIDRLLVDDYELPSGNLEEIRLVLGDNNKVVIDGVVRPLMTPSAQQSGLKIKVDEMLEPNYSYTFILDFDVDKSIVMAGNSGNINLKPVIRASVEANTGAVSGMISPANFMAEVSATNGIEIITTNTDSTGNFLLLGLNQGTYIVTITPDPTSGLEVMALDPIEVNVGQTEDLGTIDIDPNN
ncbi:protein of unknown function [Flavobacteriaceae bacterium MAR_2010_188]|nr:protein of unknown function [Flavobacteriaceae bacterium MAR_2010_188]